MKTIKKISVLAFLGVALALGSCNAINNNSSSSSASSASSSIASSSESSSSSSSSSSETKKESSSSSSSVDENLITNDDLSRGATEYKDADGKTQKLTRSQLYANAGSPHVNSYPTTGKKQKLLVAPIKFTKNSDDKLDTIDANDALLEKIRITFTGTQEEIDKVGGTISVQSFYEQSSFGKGAFDVVMIPTWIDFGMTAVDFKKSTSAAGVSAAEKVREWYIDEYAKDNHGELGADAYSLDDLDSDDDGFIDLIWNVYAYPYDTNNDTSFWWAYVTYTGNQAGTLKTPTVQTLAWASTNFLAEGSNGYESRTFIHETGHTLGLDDYYDYNKEWSPAGGIDYMDQNLGDHNSYSKFAYGWVNPWVLKEEDLEGGKTAEITLRLATTSGDCLVLASPDYNNTAFDEYMMVELVGPYGLCKKDYTTQSGFTKYGIRVWHIDARAIASNDYQYEETFSTPDEVGQKAFDLRNDNSKFGRGKDGDYWTTSSGIKRSYSQISILEASWDDKTNAQTSTTYKATDSSLFRKNSTFNLKDSGGKDRATTYMPSQSALWNKAKKITNKSKLKQEYTIDDTMTCDYSFRVMSITDDSDYGAVAKIKVTLI